MTVINATEVRPGYLIEPSPDWGEWAAPNTVLEVVAMDRIVLLLFPNGGASIHANNYLFVLHNEGS